jgi:hypothetical protein
MHRRVLIFLAVFALLSGAAGLVSAATAPISVGACASGSGYLRLVSNGTCGSNTPVRIPTTKHPGVAKAWAHVIGGELDAAGSWNITTSNLYRQTDGVYCLRGLGFTPKHVQVTLDYWGPSNGQIPIASTSMSIGNYTNCGLATAPQVFIFIGLIDPGVFTDGVDFGFFVTVY